MLPADVVLWHGRVHTVNATNAVADAVAIAGERIIAVGSDAAIREHVRPATRVIDLRGRSVVPGFLDNHIHLESFARQLSWVDCSVGAVSSITEILDGVRARVAGTSRGEWILGSRYNQDRLVERRHPNRQDLDGASEHHPIGLHHASGMAWTFNSAALRLMGINRDTPDPPGGRIDRDEHGEPLGPLWNNARARFVDPILPQPGQAERLQAYRKLCRELNRLGVTSAVEADFRYPEQLDAWQTLRRDGDLSLRVNLVTYIVRSDRWESETAGGCLFDAGVQTGFGDPWLRVGALCIGIDGTGLGRTAALTEPYADDPSGTFRGMLRVSTEQAVTFARKGHERGCQLALEPMGDRGIAVALDALSAIVGNSPAGADGAPRHRLEHAYLWNPELIRRAAQLGVIWNTQPPLLQTYGRRSTLDAWGPDRALWGFPFRSAVQAGIVVSGGSDAPVAPANPLVGLDCLLTHRLDADGSVLNAEQSVSLDDALRIYTLNGAYACGEETLKGSLETGKLADLVVLSGDLAEAAPDHITQLRTELTMVGGRIVFEHPD
jgi:predicted amidohydrolase YtcJ